MSDLKTVEGIGDKYAGILRKAGINTAENLLERGQSKQGRIKLSKETGISEKLILTWVNHVDLFRINGVSEEYADLLEASGVDSVPELAQRNSKNLTEQIKATNEKKHLVRKLPQLATVKDWIEQAKEIPKKVTH